MQGVRGRDKSPGRFRTAQNWIGRRGHGLAQALYVPPVAAELMVYLHDWECYYHAEAPDPLVQLAIVHAQFELIHPFLAGNGRIGRILVPVFLFEKGLLGHPRFYLSTWIEAHRDEYVDRLHGLGQEDAAWDAWIEFFLTGLYEQAQANTQKVQAIRALYRRLQTEIIHLTKSAYAVPLLDSLFRTPIFSLPRLTLAGPRPSRPALSELLLKLKAAGIVSVLEESAGRRAALYTLRELFDLCEGEGAGGPGRP